MSRLELPVIRGDQPDAGRDDARLPPPRRPLEGDRSAAFVLGNPKAWLGTAYHEVLEKIVEIELETRNSRQRSRASCGTKPSRPNISARAGPRARPPFRPPATWPGYHVARASVLLRAGELVGAAAAVPRSRRVARLAAAAIREQEFTAFDGRARRAPGCHPRRRNHRLQEWRDRRVRRGRADDVVKAAYVRQLRIYGYWCRKTLGWWPQRGLLLPLAGAGVEVALDPADARRRQPKR